MVAFLPDSWGITKVDDTKVIPTDGKSHLNIFLKTIVSVFSVTVAGNVADSETFHRVLLNRLNLL